MSAQRAAGGVLAAIAAVGCAAGLFWLSTRSGGPGAPAIDPLPAAVAPPASETRASPARPVVSEAQRREAVPCHEQGHFYGGIGALHSAVEALTRARTLDPLDACVCCDLGEVHAWLGDDVAATRDFGAALELDPRLTRAWRGRGGSFLRLRDLRSAGADLDRAVALAPDDGLAHELRAETRQRGGDVSGALADLDRAIALRPTHEGLWLRAQLRVAQGELRGALDDLQRFLERAPAADHRRISARGTAGTLRQQLESAEQR